MGAQHPRGSCRLQGAAVGPVVKKTGSWALSSRPGSLISSLPTGPRVKHLNLLMLTFLLVREICFLLGPFHRWGLSHWTLDPEELGTSPTVTQLTAAIPVAEAWCLVFGSGYRGQHWTVPRRAQRRPPWWDACPEAPAPWPARLGVGCSLPACLAAGHSLGLGAFALYSGLKEGGQVTNVVALPSPHHQASDLSSVATDRQCPLYLENCLWANRSHSVKYITHCNDSHIGQKAPQPHRARWEQLCGAVNAPGLLE